MCEKNSISDLTNRIISLDTDELRKVVDYITTRNYKLFTNILFELYNKGQYNKAYELTCLYVDFYNL